jgi:hypothetical protein
MPRAVNMGGASDILFASEAEFRETLAELESYISDRTDITEHGSANDYMRFGLALRVLKSRAQVTA